MTVTVPSTSSASSTATQSSASRSRRLGVPQLVVYPDSVAAGRLA